MTEREEEQPVVKVTDKRKFNLDGSLREGVEIEPEKPKEEVKFDTLPSEIISSASAAASPTAGPRMISRFTTTSFQKDGGYRLRRTPYSLPAK